MYAAQRFEAFKTAQTNADGIYQFTDVPAGVYTVEVLDLRQNLSETAERYNASSIDIVVAYPYLTQLPDCVVDEKMETITGQGQVQFTLTWGTEASGASSDIDSHLVGPRADGDGEFHVYYGDRNYYYNGEKMADLDVDDVDYEGPEHTTIYEETDGVYQFYIHNFSESNTVDSEMLGKSSIRVTVTIGSNTIVYHCPNQKGNLWYVCDYDSRTHTIIPRNTVSNFIGDTEDIGLSEEELNAKYLERKKSEALENAALAKRDLMRFSDNAAKTEITAKIEALEGQVGSAANLEAVESILTELRQIQDTLDNVSDSFDLTADNLLKTSYKDTVYEYGEDGNLIRVRSVIRCSLDFGETLKNPDVTPPERAVLESTTEAGYPYVVHVTDSETGLILDVWLQILANQAQAELADLARQCSIYMGLFEENAGIAADKAVVDGILDGMDQITDTESYSEASEKLYDIQDKYESLSYTFSIDSVTAESGMSDWWTTQDIIYDEDGEEEIGKRAVLKIERYADVTDEEILSKLNITFSNDTIEYEIADSDAEGYAKLIKATNADGFVKKIYIKITEW